MPIYFVIRTPTHKTNYEADLTNSRRETDNSKSFFFGGGKERERESENDNYWYVGWDREDRRWTWEGPNSDGSKGKVKWIFGEESQKRAYKKPGRVGVNEAKARYGPQAFRQEKLKKKLIDINLQIGHETRTPYMCSIGPDNTEDWLENIKYIWAPQ